MTKERRGVSTLCHECALFGVVQQYKQGPIRGETVQLHVRNLRPVDKRSRAKEPTAQRYVRGASQYRLNSLGLMRLYGV